MNIIKPVITFIFCLGAMVSSGQDKQNEQAKGKNDTIRVAVTMVDGFLIPWLPLNEVPIYGQRIKTPDQRLNYNRLRYNVLKVLPYAIYAKNRYNQLQKDLAVTGDKKEQKKLVKACDEQIKSMFNKEIKNMSISQGDILIKLIDRETGRSSFDMVRQLKGGITAFCYQSVARVFGHDLKAEYNPEQERDIEAILQTTPYYGYN